jgi:hypothetical protein
MRVRPLGAGFGRRTGPQDGRRTIMKRRILCRSLAMLGGVILGLGVQRAVAADDCLYKGTKYSEGAASCQAGVQFRCNDGEWKSIGVACSDTPLASARNCQFGGVTYPSGSASCQGGNQFRCDDGTWASLGIGCAAGDSPIRVVPQGRICYFNGAPVAHNSSVCQSGRSYLCSDGEWVILGTKCRS